MTRLAHAPLLCELHAHTTGSDGPQTIGQLVDAYGRAGFDVLSVTGHVARADDPPGVPQHVHARNHSAYVMAIEIEAARARVQYDMLVLPGLDLTYDDPIPCVPRPPPARSRSRAARSGDAAGALPSRSWKNVGPRGVV
ncbi:MAG TPA: hypothetical protein VFD90_05610 [Gaiellales bacterium]|jgi:hypothetical protein|nr:hypothetical protein [Gaiellales bacterium]